jgi:hypothetical protein
LNDGVPDSFSDMSAGTLLRWVRADAAGDIGSNGQKLAQLIDVAAQRALQPEIDSESRAVFREAALGAIGIARMTRALPAYYCDRRELGGLNGFGVKGKWCLRFFSARFLLVLISSKPIPLTGAKRILKSKRIFGWQGSCLNIWRSSDHFLRVGLARSWTDGLRMPSTFLSELFGRTSSNGSAPRGATTRSGRSCC